MSPLDHAAPRWTPATGPAVDVGNARLNAHWAAQLASAPAATLGPARDDDSHTNLEWLASLGALAGRPVGDAGLRAALRIADLSLLVVRGDEIETERSLAATTLDEGLSWLASELQSREVGDGALALPKQPDMPELPGGNDAPLDASDSAGLHELARWFGNADVLLQAVAAGLDGASEVRCWPHHFDIATLITLKEKQGDEDMHSVGVGLSPGDGGIPEPYFYVTPWPYPSGSLPPLPSGGSWNTQGWIGAVLRGSKLAAVPAEHQGRAVVDFLKAAIGACYGALGYNISAL